MSDNENEALKINANKTKIISNSKKSKKKKRCNHPQCKKKITLTDIPCRCKKVFCRKHRYATEHNCIFNYVEFGKCNLTKNNPTINFTKILKI